MQTLHTFVVELISDLQRLPEEQRKHHYDEMMFGSSRIGKRAVLAEMAKSPVLSSLYASIPKA
jgi:hypothetical protein